MTIKEKRKRKREKVDEKRRGGEGKKREREDEQDRERRKVRQTSREKGEKRDYTRHQQQPLKFTCPSSLGLCLLHHFIKLFSGQCVSKLLHGGNFSGCHPF